MRVRVLYLKVDFYISYFIFWCLLCQLRSVFNFDTLFVSILECN